MVVLCLRFRTGTQILIYFPVLLQISSVTLGQLLWEKHVKAPKWLMNPSPFSRRVIAADSQKGKHVGMLTIARATHKATVCCPNTFQFWAPAAPEEMAVFWKGIVNEQKMVWEGSAGTVEQAVLGPAPFHGFQILLITGRGSSVMPGSVQTEDVRNYMTGLPWETQGLLAIGILLGSKKKEPGTIIFLKCKWFWCRKPATWLAAHQHHSASELKHPSQKSKGSGKKDGQGHVILSYPQSVKLNFSWTTALQ